MPNLKELKEIIQKAVPEIMELKWGCEFDIGNEPRDWATKVTLIAHNEDNGLMYFRELDGSVFHIRGLKKEYKILGRPITLADVLITISKTKYIKARVSDKGKIRIDDSCFIGQEIGRRGEGQIACDWNLNKTLDDQSPECIEFLLNTLKKDI